MTMAGMVPGASGGALGMPGLPGAGLPGAPVTAPGMAQPLPGPAANGVYGMPQGACWLA